MVVSVKVAVFLVAVLCSLVEVYQRLRGPTLLHCQGDKEGTLKHWLTFTRLHDATAQKTAIFMYYLEHKFLCFLFFGTC
jgi:hypothetical protein